MNLTFLQMFGSLTAVFGNKQEFESLDFWPDTNMNGYAYFHRVDRTNGGDVNATHHTGYAKKHPFWY
ncbi:hypothetical protein GUITHDRAFT_106928 [Guillardia theta CCMP2712]|uniref:Uncharacterized protein n=1 Tax=Guillardia theta (strain CCMP2712) TaxID=905079 RepID=L1JG64_GUITC|nr:hypothetical protein GUITHDRAFT_106928 [Guillardia theta CCMP2712]EKX47491.1 hypothetical protein GUITHDRAFT_106928 [Guillardia theta CCMP2712]|eukprot:XP_005834471.1 hypothetical protein GUITHDRAFT_106928 [Guillardia theta CCMP2712]